MLGGTRRIAALLTLLVLVAAGAACGDDDENGNGSDGTTASSGTPTSAPPTTRPAPRTASVRVYFAGNEKVATAGREVEPPALARGALMALLAGPNGLETGIGMSTAIPNGTELNGISISDAEATADLSQEFVGGGGSLSMQVRVAQIVFTLTQFESVDTVSIRIDGDDVTSIGGEGVPATDLDRSDFEAVTPFILVESPVPGEPVSSPLVISGIANTFEANVRYSVEASSGEVLADGFTTASAGTGVWGDFSASVNFAPTPGAGTVTAWQDSAETGEPIDVYGVPVELG